MATVRVQQVHSLGREGAKTALASFEQMLGKYHVKLNWSGAKADIKGMGVSGDVHVSDTDVAVRVELGTMAKLAGVDAVKLEASIVKRLKEALAPST